MNAKRKAVLDRIEWLEEAIGRAREYLEIGKHGDWSGFRPLFVRKLWYGMELPPHKDWVKNVFLARMEKKLNRAEKILERLAGQQRLRTRDNHRRQRTSRIRSACSLNQKRGTAAPERSASQKSS